MAIYGTALLSLCLLAGLIAGRLLGMLLGLDSNVGGVGIAMLLLIWGSERLRRLGKFPPASEQGVLFWSSIYIPVTVAMAASQNVRAAVQGGGIAIAAGVLSVAACFLLVPVVSRIGKPGPPRTTHPESSTP
ncbi:malonate transporter subunit MadL [Haloferula sargassicola]|uniref:Malonate transporter subunit MadL n=1 Tax=Haloferula sargassicola TaxID=490096 RepID=A0ABP9UY46_9BACT